MKPQPTHNISAFRAQDLLFMGQPVTSAFVEGELKIETDENWGKAIVFENCIIEYFSGMMTHFEKPVKFIGCRFIDCHFAYTYFLGGLTIENCSFDGYLDFQAGGHNSDPVKIRNNNFQAFVNFFDCWFEDEVSICDNQFKQGTNLLGKPNNIPVTFDKAPVIENNQGPLEMDHEGK